MKKYSLILCFILALVYIASCASSQQEPATTPKPEAKADVKQPVEEPAIAPKQEISAEMQELLDKSKSRVRSIYYKYRATETGSNFYEFYVKGSNIKYLPYREIKSLDKPESFDSIFIDKTAKTAQSYCIAAYCAYKGKKADLNYAEAYIPTIFDWIDDLTEAKKTGEEVIDSRNTWKVETNQGILWIDTFYGIPLKVESGGKEYTFQQISVNSVQDSDVMP